MGKKVGGKNIRGSKYKYEFDSNGNIIMNGEKRWIFVKYLGDDKAIYSEEADPSYILFNKQSSKRTTIYSMIYIAGENYEVYFIDGMQSQNWKANYSSQVIKFYDKYLYDKENANWLYYPHMMDTDLDINKKGELWGYLNIAQ